MSTRTRAALVAAAVLCLCALTAVASGAQGSGLVGHRAERSERLVYPAGGSRAWPAGASLHTVTVVSGRITVAAAGQRRVYGSGETFVAGWAPYQAVNETAAPVETAVTWHRPATEE